MKTNWKWILGLVVLLVILFFLPTLWQNLFGFGGQHPMMMDGLHNWGSGRMGGTGYAMFGGLLMGAGMLFAWLIPLGLLFGVVYAALALFNRNHPASPTAPEIRCGNCGEAVETGWKACPHCGEKL